MAMGSQMQMETLFVMFSLTGRLVFPLSGGFCHLLIISVVAESLQAPFVYPIFSCCGPEDNDHQTEKALACLVTGYFPEPVDVKWNSGKVTQGITTFPAVLGKDGAFTHTSQLTIPASSLERGAFQCDVEHRASNTFLSKVFPQQPCRGVLPVPPRVHLLPPSCNDNSWEKQLRLVCLLLDFIPGQANVEWLMNGVKKSLPGMGFSSAEGTGGLHMGQSQVNITRESWNNGDVYTCKVTHPALDKEDLMVNVSKCSACLSNSVDPSIYVILPSYDDLVENEGLVTCLVLGYSIAGAQVSWEVDGEASSLAETGTVVTQDNGTQSVTSTHRITLAQWKARTRFTCNAVLPCSREVRQDAPTMDATHPAQAPTASVSVSRLDPDETPGKGDSFILLCDVTGFFPQEISLHWEHKGVKVFPDQYTNGSIIRTGQTFSTHSLLRVPQLEAERATVSDYSCVVQHVALEDALKVTALTGEGPCKPLQVEVFLRPPSLEDLYLAKNATITCLVINMETTSSLEITWNRTSGGRLDVVLTKPVFQRNGSYSVSSALLVHLDEWKSGEEFTCMVKHQDIPSAIVKTVHKSQEVSTRAPSVYVYPPHVDELALRESATVTCLAKGFRPSDILVTWTQQDQPMPRKAFINIGPFQETREKGTTYFIYSKLSVPASQWQRGDTFACVVGHEGFPMTFVHRSVDKSSGKPTAVNVSVVLSDTDVSCY